MSYIFLSFKQHFLLIATNLLLFVLRKSKGYRVTSFVASNISIWCYSHSNFDNGATCMGLRPWVGIVEATCLWSGSLGWETFVCAYFGVRRLLLAFTTSYTIYIILCFYLHLVVFVAMGCHDSQRPADVIEVEVGYDSDLFIISRDILISNHSQYLQSQELFYMNGTLLRTAETAAVVSSRRSQLQNGLRTL